MPTVGGGIASRNGLTVIRKTGSRPFRARLLPEERTPQAPACRAQSPCKCVAAALRRIGRRSANPTDLRRTERPCAGVGKSGRRNTEPGCEVPHPPERGAVGPKPVLHRTDAGHRGDRHVGKFAALVLEVAGDGDHRGVVRRELEFRQVGVPLSFGALPFDGRAQPGVGRYAAGDGDFADVVLFGRLDELAQQDVDDRALERGAEVGLVPFDEIGVFVHPIAEEIEKRNLVSTERVIESVDRVAGVAGERLQFGGMRKR